MKSRLFLLFLLVISLQLNAFRNWQSFTNTNHIYCGSTFNDKIYFGTWGGVIIFNPLTQEFEKTLRNIEGLSDIDIVSTKEINQTNQIAIATRNQGVNFYSNDNFQVPLTPYLGLLSNKVTAVNVIDSYLLIGTEAGLSVFENNTNFPYPLLLNNYENSDKLPQKKINDISVNSSLGYIFITTDSGFVYVHKDSLNYSNSWHKALVGKKTIKVFTRNNIGVITTNNGGYRFDFSNHNLDNPSSLKRFLPTDSLYACYIDKDENIICSYGFWDNVNQIFIKNYSKVLVKITPNNDYTFLYFDNPDNPQETVTSFTEYKNSLYVNSWGEGTYEMFDNKNTISFINYKPNCIGSNITTRITVDKKGKVWVCDGYMGNTPTAKGTKGISGFDGNNWVNYNTKNSGLSSDNIFCLETDSQNRKWFGSWSSFSPGKSGVSILNDNDPENILWKTIQYPLYNTTIANISLNPKDNTMWVASYTGGVNILNTEDQVVNRFKIPSVTANDYFCFHYDTDRTYIGTKLAGLHYWDKDSIPETNGSFWKRPEISDLTTGKIYDIVTYENDYTNQLWVSSSGLYMQETIGDTKNWYKYESLVKRKILASGSLVDDQHYYADEERMFGAITTTVSCIELDPFGRVWIGSEGQGFSIYDIETDRFTNYKTNNFPLLSDYITDFHYSSIDGIMYIGTNRGLNSVEIGKKEKTTTELGNIIVFPNPFYPQKSNSVTLRNTSGNSMPMGKTSCKIFDLNAQLVIELSENRFNEYEWNGKNANGKECASGLYFYLLQTELGAKKGKIVLIR